MPDSHTQKMQISLGALVGSVIPLGLVVGGLGAYPTWRVSGAQGLLALLASALVVLAVMTTSAVIMCRLAARGPYPAARAFVFGSLARVTACLALTGAVWEFTDLPAGALLIWSGLFYMVMVACEACWMARALQRDAYLVHLGEISRKNP